MSRLKPILSLVLTVLALQLSAQTEMDSTVYGVIEASMEHDSLESAIIAAGLDDDLDAEGTFTVFAPTNAAFEALPDSVLMSLFDPANAADLASILSYHVLADTVSSDSLEDGMSMFSATLSEGDSVFIRKMGDSLMINGMMVTMMDIRADNGIVHVIDAVLMMPAATVVDAIVADSMLTTLATGVTAAGLGDALSGDGPFTVFAPNNGAFDNLADGMLDSLLADPTGDLAGILQYHVVNGRFTSGDLMDGMMLTTLQGMDLEISADASGSVMVDSANVVRTDILADNGVVHVIDGILMPDTSTSVREPAFAAEVTIAPNPAASFTTVRLPFEILDNTQFTLRDMSGRVIFQRQATGERERINTEALPSGTYLLQIRADAGSIQRRIVVQN